MGKRRYRLRAVTSLESVVSVVLAVALLPVAAVALATVPARAATPSFTIVVLPDTQIAVQNHPEYFDAQTQWIADNRTANNVQFVIHVGDVVEWPARTSDWERASRAMHRLDGKVPYTVAVGNHDMDAWSRGGYDAVAADRSTARFNTYFSYSLFSTMGTFGGAYPANASDNTVHRFSAGGVDWLVLTLKYNPTDAELAWAANVVATNPTRQVIVDTHDFTDGTTRSTVGQRIWNAVAGRFANVSMVVSGHYTNQGYRADIGVNGNVVHQVMADYQTYSEPAAAENSYLRLMRFSPDAGTVDVRTYSPYFNTYKTDLPNQFTISGLQRHQVPTRRADTNGRGGPDRGSAG
jgi:hypothetical protein